MQFARLVVALLAAMTVTACQNSGPVEAARPNQWDGRYAGKGTFISLGGGRCIQPPDEKVIFVRDNKMALIVGIADNIITIDGAGKFYGHISTLELSGYIKDGTMFVESTNGECIFKDELKKTSGTQRPASQPRSATIPPTAPAPAPVFSPVAQPNSQDVAQRLRALKSLFDQGLITSSEYETKRRGIVDGL